MSPLKNTKQEIQKRTPKYYPSTTPLCCEHPPLLPLQLALQQGSHLPLVPPSAPPAFPPRWVQPSAGCPKSLWRSPGLSFLCTVLSMTRRQETRVTVTSVTIFWIFLGCTHQMLFFFPGPLNWTSSPQQNAVIKKSRMFFQASYQRHI